MVTATRSREDTVAGTVETVYCCKDDFSAGRLRTDAGAACQYKARFATQIGERVAMRGAWQVDPKYGEQFAARTLVYDDAMNVAGLEHWLATNPAFFGIGPVRAAAIARACGDDFDRIIREEPKRVQQAAGLTSYQLTTLRREWLASSKRNALHTWLAAFELTPTQIRTLVGRYGDDTRRILEANPYTLCREVRGYGFARTDAIAMRMGVDKMHPGRLQACLLDIVNAATNEGHCWIGSDELLRAAEGKLSIDTADERTLVLAAVTALVTTGQLHRDDLDDRIGHPALYHAEAYLAATLRAAPPLDQPPSRERVAYIEDVLPMPHELNAQQAEALFTALASRVCVIAGEAGTGKSYLINAIRMAHRLHGKVVLMAAPTGKASKRMEELCNRDRTDEAAYVPAYTIHRLLGYNPGKPEGEQWQYHSAAPLDADVVIVDECGMLDVALARRLFEAIDLTRTQLVLVGDHQQLPPVGAGNLLRDLLAGDFCPKIILDQVVRQAGTLKENCVSILHGAVPDTTPGEAGTLRPWYRANTCNAPAEVLACLLDVIEHQLPKVGMSAPRDWQVLTPQHSTPIGTKALNLHLQRLVQRMHYGRELPAVPDGDKLPRAKFYPGDRVINTHNNYKLGIMNGAQGTVTEVDLSDGAIEVDFSDNGAPDLVLVAGEDLQALQLAYALTIHKAQGSEYPCVIAVCHRAHSFMLSRNLLYTAVTRARQTVVLIGDAIGMRRAVTTTRSAERRTWLAAWRQPARTDEREEEGR